MTRQLTPNSPAVSRFAASERFSDAEQVLMRQSFAERLRIAFDHATNAEIARKLKTTDATVKMYTDAARLPVYEILAQVARVTGCNLHWLITGTGPRRVTPIGDLFTTDEEAVVHKLAAASGRSFEEQVRVLAMAAVELVGKV